MIQFFFIAKVYSLKIFQNFANHFFSSILIYNSFSAWVSSVISYSTILIVYPIIIYKGMTNLKPPHSVIKSAAFLSIQTSREMIYAIIKSGVSYTDSVSSFNNFFY
jgi:hypothetical protein